METIVSLVPIVRDESRVRQGLRQGGHRCRTHPAHGFCLHSLFASMTGGRFRFFGLHGLPGIVSSVLVFRSQLVGLLQQGDLLVIGGVRFDLRRRKLLAQRLDLCTQTLFLFVFRRFFVEGAEGLAELPAGGVRSIERVVLPRSRVSTVSSRRSAIRGRSGCFGKCRGIGNRCGFDSLLASERESVLFERAHLLLLPEPLLLLFVGALLVCDDPGTFGIGYRSVEACPHLRRLPFGCRRCEDPPHARPESGEHRSEDQIFLHGLPCRPFILLPCHRACHSCG